MTLLVMRVFWRSFMMSGTTLLRPAARRALSSRSIDVRLENASAQPLRPHGHFGPFSSRTMCPISPAAPRKPRSSSPSTISPPPTPVPTQMPTARFAPLAAPYACSPWIATWTSLPNATGTPNRAFRIDPSGTSVQPRLGAFATTPFFGSTAPGAPMPIASIFDSLIFASFAASSICSTICAIVSSAFPCFVAVSLAPRTLPFSFATTAIMLVPPRSTPT